MTDRSPMHQQIDTLPGLLREIVPLFDQSARATFDFELCSSIKRIMLVGCGDSHHASVGAELAFNQITGIPTQAYSSLTYGRYNVAYMPKTGPNTNLTIAVSVSGVVTRTVEALTLARKAGATGIALTGNPNARLAQNADKVFQTTVPPLPDEMKGMIVPGVRSYLASQVALITAAIRIGEVRGHITTADADKLRAELLGLGDVMQRVIERCEPLCERVVNEWNDVREFVFVGAGPLYGAAMFSAAKILEASGDSAYAQETEEWAHLQYFASPPRVPTILLDAGGLAADRMAEVARAAQSIDRRVLGILPDDEGRISAFVDTVLPIPAGVREIFASILYSVPGELLAAARAQALGAEYFQGFGGGRTVDWAQGASRIYDGSMIEDLMS
ncbi:MAG: SIS domain-containing protein [bacterium]|nr:SIS domain-containing protein [bacterium]